VLRGAVAVRRRVAAFAAAAAVAAALVFVAAASAYIQDKYFNSNLCAHCEAPAGYDASRQWNKVYRPIGIHFCLQYLGGSCVYNTWDNPFVDNRSTFFGDPGCWDDDTVASYPTTCISTYPG
jgi:hypothetical protein